MASDIQRGKREVALWQAIEGMTCRSGTIPGRSRSGGWRSWYRGGLGRVSARVWVLPRLGLHDAGVRERLDGAVAV